MAHQPAMRPSDAVAIAGKPFMDQRLAEARQPVGPGTGRVGVNRDVIGLDAAKRV